jgi:hypothetical protein
MIRIQTIRRATTRAAAGATLLLSVSACSDKFSRHQPQRDERRSIRRRHPTPPLALSAQQNYTAIGSPERYGGGSRKK